MSKSVASLTADDFEPHTGETFHLKTTKGALELKLVEVQRLGQALREGGAFSLMFVSAPGPFAPQATYPLAHPALGTIELFVVPLGPKDGGNRYEVIFT
jgi:hypothetical protein